VYDSIEDKKAETWKNNKYKSGVHRWINTVTRSSYVGSSTVLNRRIKCYLETNYLKTYKHKSVIYSDILKYGLSVFRLEILEHCAKEDVTLREQFYLNTLKPTYNILKLAGSSLWFKHSCSTIVQMKERNNKNHPFLSREYS
jgi:group I intron endonuclease